MKLNNEKHKLGKDFIECIDACLPEILEGNFKITWGHMTLSKQHPLGTASCCLFIVLDCEGYIEISDMNTEGVDWNTKNISYKFKEGFKKEDIMNPIFEKSFRTQYEDCLEWYMK